MHHDLAPGHPSLSSSLTVLRQSLLPSTLPYTPLIPNPRLALTRSVQSDLHRGKTLPTVSVPSPSPPATISSLAIRLSPLSLLYVRSSHSFTGFHVVFPVRQGTPRSRKDEPAAAEDKGGEGGKGWRGRPDLTEAAASHNDIHCVLKAVIQPLLKKIISTLNQHDKMIKR